MRLLQTPRRSSRASDHRWSVAVALPWLLACTAHGVDARDAEQDPAPAHVDVATTAHPSFEVEASLLSRSHGGAYLLTRPRLRLTNPTSVPRTITLEEVLLWDSRSAEPQHPAAVDVTPRRFPLTVPPGESTEVVLAVEGIEGAYQRAYWYEFRFTVDAREVRATSNRASYRRPHLRAPRAR